MKEEPKTSNPEARAVEEVLGSEVLADAERRAERIRRRGRRSAASIRQKAEEEARKVTRDILAQARRRGERTSQMVLATVGVEAMKTHLTLKEEVIGASLEVAWQRLLARNGYNYATVLVDLGAAAISRMPGEEFVLQLGDEDAERDGEAVCRQIEEKVSTEWGRHVQVRLSPEHPLIAGGCVVLSADGRLRYDNSFEARRRRLYQQLRRLAARDLFSMEDPNGDDQ